VSALETFSVMISERADTLFSLTVSESTMLCALTKELSGAISEWAAT
jgi:hypothetical protein